MSWLPIIVGKLFTKFVMAVSCAALLVVLRLGGVLSEVLVMEKDGKNVIMVRENTIVSIFSNLAGRV